MKFALCERFGIRTKAVAYRPYKDAAAIAESHCTGLPNAAATLMASSGPAFQLNGAAYVRRMDIPKR